MKRLLFTLEITMTMFFIVLAFVLGAIAGWQSAVNATTIEHEPQTMTLQKVGE